MSAVEEERDVVAEVEALCTYIDGLGLTWQQRTTIKATFAMIVDLACRQAVARAALPSSTEAP